MGTGEEISILIKHSPKRENVLGSMKEQTECKNDSDFQPTEAVRNTLDSACSMFQNTVSKTSR